MPRTVKLYSYTTGSMTEADVNGKILMIFIGEAKNTVAMCKTLMHYVAEAVEVYAMRNLEEIIEMKS